MQGYDKPAQDAAMIRIKEINEAGGLLGKQIEVVNADTKTDRAEGAKAGLSVIDAGGDSVIGTIGVGLSLGGFAIFVVAWLTGRKRVQTST